MVKLMIPSTTRIQPTIVSVENSTLVRWRLLIVYQIDENKEPKTKRVLREEFVNDSRIAPKPPKPFLSNSLILVAPLAPSAANKSLVRDSRSSSVAFPIHWLIS